jgi:L,D-transpeptidase catalytic domain
VAARCCTRVSESTVIGPEQLAQALDRIHPRDRELLSLSLQRRVPDEALARLYDCASTDVARRRARAIARLADEMELQRGEDLGAVLKALLEPETWTATAASVGEEFAVEAGGTRLTPVPPPDDAEIVATGPTLAPVPAAPAGTPPGEADAPAKESAPPGEGSAAEAAAGPTEAAPAPDAAPAPPDAAPAPPDAAPAAADAAPAPPDAGPAPPESAHAPPDAGPAPPDAAPPRDAAPDQAAPPGEAAPPLEAAPAGGPPAGAPPEVAPSAAAPPEVAPPPGSPPAAAPPPAAPPAGRPPLAAPPPPATDSGNGRPQVAEPAGAPAIPASTEPILDMLSGRERDVPDPPRRAVPLALLGLSVASLVGAAGVVGATQFGETNRVIQVPSSGDDGDDNTRHFLPEEGGPLAVPFPSDPRTVSCYSTAYLPQSTTLYREPGGRKRMRITAKTEWGSPRVLGVLKQQGGWLGVQAAELRNGEIAWVRRGRAQVDCVRWSLHADLSKRTLFVRRDGRTVRKMKVAIGRPENPTPKGRFTVTDKLRVTDRDSVYGCCVLALSGHQTDLPAYWPGGDRLAVHATSDVSSIGRPVSLGCLRTPAARARWLIETVPLGSPMFIRA